MTEWAEKLDPFGGPTLYWKNHDYAHELFLGFGDDSPVPEKIASKMLATLMYLSKGILLFLNGEEIGMCIESHTTRKNLKTPGAYGFFMRNPKSLRVQEEHILKELNMPQPVM